MAVAEATEGAVLTATVSEARANFSKIADQVDRSGRSVTVFRNSKPWVRIAPLSGDSGAPVPRIDWSGDDIARVNPETGMTSLPAEWDDPEDEGLYDDLA